MKKLDSILIHIRNIFIGSVSSKLMLSVGLVIVVKEFWRKQWSNTL